MADHFYGVAFVPDCSPPFGALHGTDFSGADGNVYRACIGDPAGGASQYSSFDDGAITSEGVHNPVLSPDKTKILFELANPSTGFTEIWVVANTPGSNATQLLADASNYYLHPSWHPDSDQFVCVHGASGAILGAIVSSAVSTPGTTAVLKNKSGTQSPFRPQYNFDGTRIAYLFDTNVGGTGDLMVMDDDGTNDASVDNAVKYRFQGAQFSWANASNVIAYDDGDNTVGTCKTNVINDDGTGKVQINANGDAAGLTCRVSHLAWPPDDSYVVFSANLGLGVGHNPIRAELDGSTTTDLAFSHGAWLQDNFRQVLVADNRIWFINSQVQLGSVALDGTDYVNYLTIDGAAMADFSTGDGWYFN